MLMRLAQLIFDGRTHKEYDRSMFENVKIAKFKTLQKVKVTKMATNTPNDQFFNLLNTHKAIKKISQTYMGKTGMDSL